MLAYFGLGLLEMLILAGLAGVLLFAVIVVTVIALISNRRP